MRKILLSLATALCAVFAAEAGGLPGDVLYTVRIGYSIGGTAPLDMPATIRKLNKYNLQPNISVGVDGYRNAGGRWGVMAGLHLEKKSMDIDALVKNYHMEIVRGGQSLDGYFTGHNATKADIWMITVPVLLTFDIGSVARLKLGPYASCVTSHEFSGSAYDGYLRVGNPTGAKVELGTDEGTRGTYDFSDKMRRMQYGILLGADWHVHKRWGAYTDISWGLNGIHHSSFKTIEQTLYPIFGTIGLTYKLR